MCFSAAGEFLAPLKQKARRPKPTHWNWTELRGGVADSGKEKAGTDNTKPAFISPSATTDPRDGPAAQSDSSLS